MELKERRQKQIDTFISENKNEIIDAYGSINKFAIDLAKNIDTDFIELQILENRYLIFYSKIIELVLLLRVA